ncbi:MAG: hypothetical protein VKJ04_05195 [Vampirovibrionales bacterium]|nr:hypothetical protein [Vampirovibrionales bacterium]
MAATATQSCHEYIKHFVQLNDQSFSSDRVVIGHSTGTGGLLTYSYVISDSKRGYRFIAQEPSEAMIALPKQSLKPVDYLERISAIFQPSITDLSKIMNVSRQAIYDWKANKPISPDNIHKLSAIANVANRLADYGVKLSPQLLRRPLKGNVSFFEMIRDINAIEEAETLLLQLIKREDAQRAQVFKTFQNKSLPSVREHIDLDF